MVGGGESALYGVEGPAYYLRNGFNNFSLALPLALALPALALLAGGPSGRWQGRAEEGLAVGTWGLGVSSAAC